MRPISLVLFIFINCLICATVIKAADFDNSNDFAEFDDFDVDNDDFSDSFEDFKPSDVGGGAALNHNDKRQQQSQQSQHNQQQQAAAGGASQDDDDGIVEDDEEFEHFSDDEMFEGFDKSENKDMPEAKGGEPQLTVAKIPMHFRSHWDAYWMEMLMLAGLLAYFANFFAGKTKNARLAHNWFNVHKSLLDDNFVLVGDDGKVENENPGLIKESESLYTLWCSGRICCEGMLVELKMIKRQDLVALVSGLLRPQQDQVHIKIDLSPGIMDSFVFCVGSKKTLTKAFKEYDDLSKYCTLVNKAEERFNVPSGFSVLSEIPEATSAILENRIIVSLKKYQNYIDYIHISDQYCGMIQQDDPNTLKLPDTKPVLHAGFNLPKDGDMNEVKPLLILIFYLMERLRLYRMSKEGKAKAEKNRLRVEEEFLRSTHAARAEAAAARREEKRKQEKERVMAEEDPQKQKRWELKEQKRQAKKKAPKMKRLAVKSL